VCSSDLGYTTQPDNTLFENVTKDVGCAIIGQTGNLAPADKRFYGIRDVTATVESVPLITASILSKKLAAGLQGLVLDVKCGNGAFMDDLDKARELARSLVTVANGAGLETRAVITDMNQPLATAAGNAVEIKNTIEFLTGRQVDARAFDVTVALGASMLISGGLAKNLDDGAAKIEQAFSSGRAAEKFAQMVTALGGPADLMEKPEKHLPAAPLVMSVLAQENGSVVSIKTRDVGMAVVSLGGGRTRASDAIDPAVGYTDLALVGDAVEKGESIGYVHAGTQSQAEQAIAALLAAYEIGPARDVTDQPVVIEQLS